MIGWVVVLVVLAAALVTLWLALRRPAPGDDYPSENGDGEP